MFNLRDFGSFHVGGRSHTLAGLPAEDVSFSHRIRLQRDPNGTYLIEQAYVQYFIPEKLRFKTPVMFVHGGGLTGASWETTPDGRPGWLHAFLEAGLVCYVIDNAERGRAGFCPFPDQWDGAPLLRSSEESWDLYRLGAPANFASRTPFEGQQFPTEALQQLQAQTVPRWTSTSDLLRRNLALALDRIGPCILIAHSQGGGLSLQLRHEEARNVRACIALEPHGVPKEGPSGWPATAPLLAIFGDFIVRTELWGLKMEEVRAFIARHVRAGGSGETWYLPELGIHGNSHMIMMDRNNQPIAARVIQWLDRQFERQAFD